MLGKHRRQTMLSKISPGAARTLLEGWYTHEAELSACEATLHAQKWVQEADLGEVFELGFADIIRKDDGFYVTERKPKDSLALWLERASITYL
jgi:hypothetical protein